MTSADFSAEGPHPGLRSLHDRSRPGDGCGRKNRRTVRAPQGARVPVRHRDVGALLLLRDARPPRALHGEIPVAGGPGRDRGGAHGPAAGARMAVRPARYPAARLADLRLLYRPRLSDADPRRPSGGSRTGAAAHRRCRCRADGDRPLHDGVRDAVPVRAAGPDPRQRRLQAQHLTQVGGLYAAGDRRRDRAFSIFYVGINLGAFLAPLVCGTLGEAAGWHYGFAAAGVGMTLGLAIYLYAVPTLPPDALALRRAAGEARRFGREEWRAILALLILSLPVTFYWATYEQQGNTIALWADQYTDRAIDLKFFETEIPTTWFQAFNPFMIFAFTPLIVALWGWQGARGSEPSTVSKMAIGCFLNAASYLILFVAAWHSGDAKASWLWLLAYFIVITIGELYLSPTALALVSKVAPAGFLSMMMGVWLATSFYGGFLAGYLGSFWSGMAKQDFFLMIAIIAALAGVAVVSFHRPLKAILKE